MKSKQTSFIFLLYFFTSFFSYGNTSAIFSEDPIPEFSISSSNGSNICSSESTILSSDIDNPLNYDFEWSINGNVISTESEITVSAPEEYTLKLTDGEDFGIQSFILEVHYLQIAIETDQENLDLCVGEEVELTINGATSINWINPAGLVDQTIIVQPTENNHIFSASITNNFGCDSLISIDFNIIVPLPVEISVNNAQTYYCEGESLTLQTNDGFISWNWNNGSQEQENNIITQNGMEEFFVDVVDGNGCSNSNSTPFDIDVRQRPTIQIMTENGESEVFTGENFVFTAINPTTDDECAGTGLINYLWNFKDFNGINVLTETSTSSELTMNFNLDHLNVTKVELIVTDACSCMSLPIGIPFQVIEDGSCSAPLEFPKSVCLGDHTQIIALVQSGNDGGLPIEGFFTIDEIQITKSMESETISTPNGSFKIIEVLSNVPNTNLNAEIIIEFLEIGQYDFYYEFIFTNCSKTSPTKTITLVDLPMLDDINIDTEICYGESPQIEFIIENEFEGDWILEYNTGNGSEQKSLVYASSNNSLIFSDLTDDLTINLSSLYSVETGCETILNETFTINTLEEITYSITDTCNSTFDSIFYTINIEGGTENYSVNNTTQLTDHIFVGEPIASGEIFSYEIEDIGCKEEYIKNIVVDQFCFSCFDIAGYIDDHSIDLPSKINVYENETYTFSFPSTIEEDTLDQINQELLYVIQKSATSTYSESNVILSLNPSATDGTISFNKDSSTEFEVNTSYFLAIYSIPVSANFNNPTCLSSNNIVIEFYDEPNGLFDENVLLDFIMLPNPNNGTFTLEINGPMMGKMDMHIFDITGTCVHSHSFSKEEIKHKEAFFIQDHSVGLYFIKLVDKKGNRHSLKWTKI